MDAMRQVYQSSVSSGNMKRSIRELKNKVYAYSEMEQMVRECTCNDAQTPSEMLMREIAKGTFTVEFSAIMAIVWKRIKDKTNEHHAYKCLVLLEYLLQHGNHEMVLSQVQNNLHHVQAVTSFTLKNANGIDVGHDVREKAHRFLKFF